MKRINIFMLAFILFVPINANAKKLNLGDMLHVTGCESGELLVPIVNMWDKPGGMKIVGKLSGNSRKKCQGAVVRILAESNHNGRVFYNVESIVNGNRGWITDSFVGKKFSKKRCKKHFKKEDHIARCLEDKK